MEMSRAKNPLNSGGQQSAPSSVTTAKLIDFCSEQARRKPVKIVQQHTGLSKKQVENIRQGLSAVSGKTLTNWIMSDPDFAGDYCEFAGVIRPGDARFATAITRLAQEVARQQTFKPFRKGED